MDPVPYVDFVPYVPQRYHCHQGDIPDQSVKEFAPFPPPGYPLDFGGLEALHKLTYSSLNTIIPLKEDIANRLLLRIVGTPFDTLHRVDHMENFRCLTRDSNNKAVYGPWDRSNVAEIGVNKCLVGVTIPWYIIKMPPLGKRKENARVLVRPWFGETDPYWHDPIPPPQLAEVYDHYKRLRNCLVAEKLQGHRRWVWSLATIVAQPLGHTNRSQVQAWLSSGGAVREGDNLTGLNP
ncbi:hypothetical protein HETIRDRAFT_424505 [Heterobasidion irregulare TC 32-1]|uniref:Uncharacterized protein n=1 Tax=Heterobasidion irregulare (strain TC 32-1) TaxID=747525 RepID=W4KH40_HETIT|nr:uncharacterized protein HETIRDRAFT_424505 [Heterobasidion irregulare TC 32-1]ETW85034.1 hypothetical protein HETIRDRAFT_424505 [Heterobasidion irregulare TC 32-1]